MVKGYRIQFLVEPRQTVEPVPLVKSDEVDLCIDRLLHIGAISRVTDIEGQFVSKIFTVPKSDGSSRLILNLKKLNKFLHAEHFKLEDGRTVMNLMRRNMFMATVDMRDAYHLVRIHPESRKYLRFRYGEDLYEYSVLPFGLSVAPLVFTKLLRPVVAFLREAGNMSVIYLDDLWLAGYDYESCNRNVTSTVSLLNHLGFLLNEDRSNCTPQQCVKYLGFMFDSVAMSVSLPQGKREKLMDLCRDVQRQKQVGLKNLAEFVGHLVSACPAVPFGLLYTRELESLKTEKLVETDGMYTGKVCLSQDAHSDIEWWKRVLPTASALIRTDTYDLEIATDASRSGYGINFQGKETWGYWSEKEKESCHINELELTAVLYTLRSFRDLVSGKTILFRIDNITAVAYVNKLGGTRSGRLLSVAKLIFKFCEQYNVWIRASYIPGAENVAADRASRMELDETDWMLNRKIFEESCRMLSFFPDIDLFASRHSNQCNCFVSWFPDPEASFVDAFTISWNNQKFYSFPPFAMIPRVIRKIVNDEGEGILVFPLWKAQAWYPLVLKHSVSDILVFGPSSNVLIYPYDSRSHPLANSLQIAVSVISGKRSRPRGYPKILYH